MSDTRRVRSNTETISTSASNSNPAVSDTSESIDHLTRLAFIECSSFLTYFPTSQLNELATRYAKLLKDCSSARDTYIRSTADGFVPHAIRIEVTLPASKELKGTTEFTSLNEKIKKLNEAYKKEATKVFISKNLAEKRLAEKRLIQFYIDFTRAILKYYLVVEYNDNKISDASYNLTILKIMNQKLHSLLPAEGNFKNNGQVTTEVEEMIGPHEIDIDDNSDMRNLDVKLQDHIYTALKESRKAFYNAVNAKQKKHKAISLFSKERINKKAQDIIEAIDETNIDIPTINKIVDKKLAAIKKTSSITNNNSTKNKNNNTSKKDKSKPTSTKNKSTTTKNKTTTTPKKDRSGDRNGSKSILKGGAATKSQIAKKADGENDKKESNRKNNKRKRVSFESSNRKSRRT